MDEEYLDDMVLEPENDMVLESEDDMALEPKVDMVLEPKNVDLIEQNLMIQMLMKTLSTFIVEELQPFSIIQSRAFKRIIEGLNVQANMLGYDHLKEILINSEHKVLQNLCEYALDTKEMIGNISYLSYPYTSECLFNKITEILDNLQLKHITVSVEINDNSSLRSYEEKKLLLDKWEKIAELVKLLYSYEIILKKLLGSTYLTLSQAYKLIQKRFSELTKPIRLAAFFDLRTKDMQIFTENKKNNTISEAHMEYLELANNYYGLD
ncbi:3668_t:CDS:2, partial [Scutellospora calospora]